MVTWLQLAFWLLTTVTLCIPVSSLEVVDTWMVASNHFLMLLTLIIHGRGSVIVRLDCHFD